MSPDTDTTFRFSIAIPVVWLSTSYAVVESVIGILSDSSAPKPKSTVTAVGFAVVGFVGSVFVGFVGFLLVGCVLELFPAVMI